MYIIFKITQSILSTRDRVVNYKFIMYKTTEWLINRIRKENPDLVVKILTLFWTWRKQEPRDVNKDG